MSADVLRNIPSVSELLETAPLKSLIGRVNRSVVVSNVRSILDDIRRDVRSPTMESGLPGLMEIADRVVRRVVHAERPLLRPVVNATGILLHTGLGRAPLAPEAIEEIVRVARGYSSVEYDLVTGERSSRSLVVENLLCQLTGASAALVVNNNAGATMLALAAIAAGKEVIVSRGQLVEIGGSFRLPDIMAASGAVLREVGTTNKTIVGDYRDAIGPESGAILRVHTSNFRIVGFTESVSLEDLMRLGRQHNLPVIDDIGSGALIDNHMAEFKDEPKAKESISLGADLVLFSGDKLLGGPQCGIVVGRSDLIEKLSRHPLARALRVGKLTLAALHGTLLLHRNGNSGKDSIPLMRLLSTSPENLRSRAERLAPQLSASPQVASAKALESETFLGGGAVPAQGLSTCCVSIEPRGFEAGELAKMLRSAETPIVARIQKERVLLDLRTVFPEQDQQILAAFSSLRSDGQSATG